MKSINCIHFQSDGKCNCKLLKRWYGKPKCVQIVEWNAFCKHKVLIKPPERNI